MAAVFPVAKLPQLASYVTSSGFCWFSLIAANISANSWNSSTSASWTLPSYKSWQNCTGSSWSANGTFMICPIRKYASWESPSPVTPSAALLSIKDISASVELISSTLTISVLYTSPKPSAVIGIPTMVSPLLAIRSSLILSINSRSPISSR